MADRDFASFGAPAAGVRTGDDLILVDDVNATTEDSGYNLTLDQVRSFVLSGSEALTAEQEEFLSKYADDILIPVVEADPDPLPPTGAPWFILGTGRFRHAVETPGDPSTTTTGTVVFAATSGGGLLFDSAAGLGSEGGLAEEITRLGWDSDDDESFEIRVTNAIDRAGPGLTDATIGSVSVRQLQQLDRTSQGYFELSGQRVARGDIVAGKPYVVTLTGQRAAFRAETLMAENLDLDGTDGADGWTPVFTEENDGERRLLRIDDWAGGAGAKPATGYFGMTGLVADKADATDYRGPAGPTGTAIADIATLHAGRTSTNKLLLAASVPDMEDVSVWRLGGTPGAVRQVQLLNSLAITPGTDAYSAWTDIMSLTVAADEAGASAVEVETTIVVGSPTQNTAGRWVRVRLVRVRNSVQTVYSYPLITRQLPFLSPGQTDATDFSNFTFIDHMRLAAQDVLQSGDEIKLQAQALTTIAQNLNPRITFQFDGAHDASPRNFMKLLSLSKPDVATKLVDAVSTSLPAGAAFVSTTADVPETDSLLIGVGDRLSPPILGSALREKAAATVGAAASAANSFEWGGVDGGSPGDGTLRVVALAAQVDYAVPPNGVFGAWSDLQSVTIAAEEEGQLHVNAIVKGVVQEASTNGAARVGTEIQLVRTRNSADTVLVEGSVYGPRNLNPGTATSAAYSAFSRNVFAEVEKDVNAEEGDVFKVQVRHLRQEPANSDARTVRYAVADNEIDISRPPSSSAGSGGSGGATAFATEAEAEAGTEPGKAISPRTLAEVLEHVRAVAADITNGVVGKLVDAAILKGVQDTLTGLIDAKLGPSAVLDVALTAFTDSELSDDVKQAFRTRIGAESEDGEYGPTATSSQRYGAIPGGLGLGPTIPDGSTHIRFTITAESEQAINYTTREITVASLLGLPNRNVNSNAISNSSGVIETNFVQRATDTPGADRQRGYIAHNGRRLLYASDQSIGASITVQFKESRVEPFALRGNPDKVPTSKLEDDVAKLDSGGHVPLAEMNPRVAVVDATTGQLPVAIVPSGAQPPAGSFFLTTDERNKLIGIADGAEVNKHSDWDNNDPEDTASILNKPEVPPVASAMPEALPSSTNRVVVQETAGRRDLGLNFSSRPGGDFDYGDIYGSVADRQGATAAHITANIGGIRYSGTAFQLDCYVLDVSQDGGDWDRVWIDGYEVAVAHEFGLATVPWSTSTTRWRHFRTAVIPQANRPDFGDPVAINFRDTSADAGQQYFVGNPYVRTATTEPLDERFTVITQDAYTALAPKVVGRIYLVTP